MLAGGDSIDDVAVLRAGATGSLFDGTRAPSTVGSWLRAHKWSNVRQLDAISRELLARLWAAGAGPGDLAAPLTIDVDSTIVEVHGRKKQGAAFGYTKVRGYHPQLATCAQTGQVLMSRLRGGSAGAARGAASFLTETVSRVRNAGATGQLTVRADSAFYSKTVISTAVKFDVRFSITAWDYHAFVTDRDLPLAQVEADHRRHAIVEQTIAELKSAGLAHLPSVISSRAMGVHDVVDGGNEALGVRRGRGYLVPSITTTRGWPCASSVFSCRGPGRSRGRCSTMISVHSSRSSGSLATSPRSNGHRTPSRPTRTT